MGLFFVFFFSLLALVIDLVGIVFSGPVFCVGSNITKQTHLNANFLTGDAKLGIYLTRRDRLQTGSKLDAVGLWRWNIKTRLKFCLKSPSISFEGDLRKFYIMCV